MVANNDTKCEACQKKLADTPDEHILCFKNNDTYVWCHRDCYSRVRFFRTLKEEGYIGW